MFRQLTNQLAAAAPAAKEAPKAMAPTLRNDIYTAMDQTRAWITGSGSVVVGQAGDGVSYAAPMSTIQKHFPDAKMGIESGGSAENEVAVVVCGVTNMILEMSRWEGMSGGMTMRTWVDGLVASHAGLAAGARKAAIGKGIVRGISQNINVGLMPKEFTTRIQIVSCLKSVCAGVYGAGSEEARQAETVLNARMI